MTDSDLVAIQNTIATETDIEVLRGIVMVRLLGGVPQRNATLERLDPRAVSVFANAEADSVRGQIARIDNLAVLRSRALDVLNKRKGLDEQIARARP